MSNVENFVEIPFSESKLAANKSDSKAPMSRRVRLPIEGYLINAEPASRLISLIGCFLMFALILFFFYLDALKGEAAVCGKFHQTHGYYCLFNDLAFAAALLPFLTATVSEVRRARLDLSEARKRPEPHLKIDRSTFWHVQLAEAIPFNKILSVSEIRFGGMKGGKAIGLEFICKEPPALNYSNGWNSISARSPSFRFSLEGFHTTAGRDAADVIKALVQLAHASDAN